MEFALNRSYPELMTPLKINRVLAVSHEHANVSFMDCAHVSVYKPDG